MGANSSVNIKLQACISTSHPVSDMTRLHNLTWHVFKTQRGANNSCRVALDRLEMTHPSLLLHRLQAIEIGHVSDAAVEAVKGRKATHSRDSGYLTP